MLRRLLFGAGGSGVLEALMGFWPVFSVRDYGAVGDGTTDDATAINNTIAALPATGGIVYFPAGDYAIAATINLGNGTTSAISSRQGINLVAAAGGSPWGGAGLSPTTYGAARLKWTGSTNGTMVSINGPVLGCGIDGLELDANSSSGTTALQLISCQYGHFPDLAIRNVTGAAAISEMTVDPFSTFTTNTMHNAWGTVRIVIDAANSTRAVLFQGSSSSANTCYETFDDLMIQTSAGVAGGATVHALEFAGCDNIIIRRLHFTGVATAGGTLVVASFNYTLSPTTNWPADCRIEDADFGFTTAFTAVASNTGSPGAGATKNRIVSISSTNGAVSDPGLSNLSWGYTAANP